ncbi:MAG: ABC transporter permease [Candidatus Pacearchaeota archaeon]|nr:ABC transporter permease [Candidatus Pacearchaeota archaeon]
MLKERIKKIYFYRHILWDMAITQLKAKYAASKLGIWWAVVTPLMLAVSINFVFTVVFKIEIKNYTLFVLAGMIPWFFSVSALTEAADSFIINSSILKQSISPREFIPMSSILANLLNFLIGLVFLLPLFIILNFRVIGLLPFLFLIIILNFIFIIGLGTLFSCVNVFFRDLTHFMSIGFMVWFWITPVFYSLDMIPFSFRLICLFNPMTHYVILYQDVLFRLTVPSLASLLIVFLISLISIFIGYFVFLKKEPSLLKRI